jgi:hypothetical protein
MTATHTLDMIERAFEIADEQMFARLECECSPQDDSWTTFGLLNESYGEVTKLADASEAIRGAVDWLVRRGYVELASDSSGEYVSVLRRPGEDE